MKKCPACNRTYADDTLSFCLEDGSLLSASFNLPEEQETVVRPNSAELPPTQFYSPPPAAHNEIPTIVSAKNANPEYQRLPERQNSQNPDSAVKAIGFLVGRASKKFSFKAFLFILFLFVLAAIYTVSIIPLIVGICAATISGLALAKKR
jgi:hypothetical protein